MISTAVRWLLVAIGVLWFAMSLTYPFGWDQGILSWAGHIVVRGGMPFRDAWDMKGPVVYYVFALSEQLFGINLWGIRLVDAALALAATWSVGRAASAVTDPVIGRWSAVLFFLWYASHSYWHTAQPDGWVAMLLALAVLPALYRPDPDGFLRFAFLGASIGVASLVKPIYLVFLLLPILATGGAARHRRPAAVTLILIGWIVPVGLCAAWFWARGALDDLIAVYLRYPAVAYAGSVRLSVGQSAWGFVEYILRAPVIAVGLPLAIFGVTTLRRTRPVTARVLGAWMLLAVVVVGLQGRFFAYHWLPILPPVVVLGAAGVHALLTRARTLALAVSCVLAVLCIAPIALEEARFLSWVGGRRSTADYYDGYGEAGNDMRSVAWLRDRGVPGKIYVFGWNTSVGWLSRRETVSRFGFSMPLLLGEGTPVRSQYRDELLRSLRADPPRYIIVGTQSQQILGRVLTVDDFPELAGLIRASYEKVAEFGQVQIHQLGPAAAPAQ